MIESPFSTKEGYAVTAATGLSPTAGPAFLAQWQQAEIEGDRNIRRCEAPVLRRLGYVAYLVVNI